MLSLGKINFSSAKAVITSKKDKSFSLLLSPMSMCKGANRVVLMILDEMNEGWNDLQISPQERHHRPAEITSKVMLGKRPDTVSLWIDSEDSGF